MPLPDAATPIQTLQLYRAAARTIRCHNVPGLHQQTVGEHTFGMLALLKIIYPEADATLLWAVLDHDVPEGITGDIPSPVLHRSLSMRRADQEAAHDVYMRYSRLTNVSTDLAFSRFSQRVYKFCDRMELCLYAVEEADTGNIKMLTLYYNAIASIEKDGLTDITPNALLVYDYIKSYVERYYGDQRDRLDAMLHGTPNK